MPAIVARCMDEDPAAALPQGYLHLRPLAPEPPGPPETWLDQPRPGDAAAA